MGKQKKSEPKTQIKSDSTMSKAEFNQPSIPPQVEKTTTRQGDYIQFTNVQKGDFKIPTKSQLSKFKVPEVDLTIENTSMTLTVKLPGTNADDIILSLNPDSLLIFSKNKKVGYYSEIKFPEEVIPQSALAKFYKETLHLNISKLSTNPTFLDDFAQLEKFRHDAQETKEKLTQTQRQFHAVQQDYQNLIVKSKKEVEDRIDAYKISVIEKLLKNIDHFELALESISKNKDKNKNNEQIMVGINLILNELRNMILEEGVTEIACEGLLLDPLQHEVLDCEESDKYPENTVLKVYQKGYKFKNRVIRPSKVRVSVPIKIEKKSTKK